MGVAHVRLTCEVVAANVGLQTHHSVLRASLRSFRADQHARLTLLCKER